MGITVLNSSPRINYAREATGFPQDSFGGPYELQLLKNQETIYSTNFSIPTPTDSSLVDFDPIDLRLKLPYFENVTRIEIKGFDLVEFRPVNIFDVLGLEPDCILIKENGAIENKLDIAFVSDNYTDLNEFRDQVIRMIDFQGQFQGLLSIEPIKSNQYKFNFYYINKTYTNLVYPIGINL